MARISVGGDPEGYMEAPQIQVGSNGGGGISPIAAIFEFLGIHRNAARTPKAKTAGSKQSNKIETAGLLRKDMASDFLDPIGSELAKQDSTQYQPVKLIDLPASDFAK